MSIFAGKTLMITGGTGSLGIALTKRLLETDIGTIRIFSRDEWKQVQMQSTLNDNRLRYLIGDIRDKERLGRALQDVDIVIHAAALKQVPIAEYNPFEAVKTNVQGTQNLIDSCIENQVETVLGISTDKAVSPLNTYGATKLLMERLFISKDYSSLNHKIKTMCVRYGNVLGSRGSVVPIFINQILNNKKITITDPSMTRFNITMKEAIDLVFRTMEKGIGGQVFIPKLKAYKVGDMKDAMLELLDSKTEVKTISVRPGEKYHEVLINQDELRYTYETDNDYILHEKRKDDDSIGSDNLKKTNLKDQYSSDKVDLINKDELKKILVNENLVNVE